MRRRHKENLTFTLLILVMWFTLAFSFAANAAAPLFWQDSNYGRFLSLLGFNLNDGKSYVSLSADPTSGGGFAAPIGSVGVRNNGGVGELWLKIGASATAWLELSGPLVSTPNRIAYYDAAGNLNPFPWVTVTYSGAQGMEALPTYTAAADSGPVTRKIQTFELEIDPAVATSQQTVVNTQIDTHLDRTGSGNDFLGGIVNFVNNLTHEGDGDGENMTVQQLSLGLGTGSTTGSSNQNTVISANASVNAGHTATSFFGYTLDLNGSGTLGSSTLFNGNQTLATTGDMTLINVGGNANSGDDFFGLNINYQGDTVGNMNPININMSGDSGAFTTMLNLNHSGNTTSGYSGVLHNLSGNVGGNTKLLDIQSSGTITGDVVGGFFNVSSPATTKSGVQVNTSGTVDGGAIQALNVQQSGDATAVGGQIYLLNASNTGDAANITGANFNLDGDADNAVGINVNMVGTSSNSATGLNIGMTSATVTPSLANPTGRKTLINGSGGSIITSGDFTTISSLPALVDSGNILNTVFNVVSGSPITGTDFLGNNLAGTLLADDDYSPSVFGLGWGAVGLVGQLAVTSGNTVDKASMMIAGGSAPVQSTGGTISEMVFYKAAGLVSAGGTLNVTDMYGFKYENLGISGTNNWAFHSSVAGAKAYLNGDLDLDANLTMKEDGVGTDRITIQTPVISSSYTLTLPVDDGSSGQVLSTDGSGVLSWIANGTFTNPMTTAGDMIYGGAAGAPTRLAAGTSGQMVQSAGSSVAWSTATYPSTTTAPCALLSNTSDSVTCLAATTANRLLKTNGTTLSFAQADLTTDVTGTLPVGNGGTGTSTAFTQGSVVFAGPSGVYAQDNSNLFWNDTDDTLLVGHPTAIVGTPSLQVVATDTSLLDLLTFSATSSSAPIFQMLRSKSGTKGTNSIVASGDMLGTVNYAGADGTNYIPAARIVSEVDGTPGTNDMPGRLLFLTTPDGSGTPAEAMRITSAQDVLIGHPSYLVGTPSVQVVASDASVLDLWTFNTTAGTGPIAQFLRSKSGTKGTNTAVADGDLLGTLNFAGADGTSYIPAARINVEVDGTPGTNDMPGRMIFLTTPDGSATPAERMRIDDLGLIFMNTTTRRNSSRLSMDFAGLSAAGMGLNDTDSANGSVFMSFLTGGTYRGGITNNNNTAVAYNTTSDENLKKEFRNMSPTLSKVRAMKLFRYKWKHNNYEEEGITAQEVKKFFPHCVTDSPGIPMGVDKGCLAPFAFKAVQELAAKVEELEVRTQALETKSLEIDALKARLDALEAK